MNQVVIYLVYTRYISEKVNFWGFQMQSDLTQSDLQLPLPLTDAVSSPPSHPSGSRNTPPAGSVSVSASDLKKGEAVFVCFNLKRVQTKPGLLGGIKAPSLFPSATATRL